MQSREDADPTPDGHDGGGGRPKGDTGRPVAGSGLADEAVGAMTTVITSRMSKGPLGHRGRSKRRDLGDCRKAEHAPMKRPRYAACDEADRKRWTGWGYARARLSPPRAPEGDRGKAGA